MLFRLWKALALSNGWRLPDDVSTATRDIMAKLNRAKAMPGTGSGAWKAWFISALVERVLDGKTERELVAAEDDHHQQTKKKKKKRVNRGFEDTNDAGGEEAEAADDDDEEEEDEEEEDATSYSNNSKVQMASRQVVVSRPIGLDDEPAAEVHTHFVAPLLRSSSSLFALSHRWRDHCRSCRGAPCGASSTSC
jgi:hypothetical protein